MTHPPSHAFDDGEPMTVTGSRARTVLTITLTGSIDIATAKAVLTALEDLLVVTGGQVILDLAGVEFCDVAGLRVLAEAQHHAAARGAACRIRNPAPHIDWLLQATGAAAVFGVTRPGARHDHDRSRPRGKPGGNAAPAR